jgi:hypothetical protein
MAKENPGWGYDRIVGALANLGFLLSDQTVGNILRRHGRWLANCYVRADFTGNRGAQVNWLSLSERIRWQ